MRFDERGYRKHWLIGSLIIVATLVVSISFVSYRSHPYLSRSVADAFMTNGQMGEYDIRAFGAVANDGNDDAAATQAAIDACQNDVDQGNFTGAGVVHIPQGAWNWATSIVWKSCHLVGVFPNNSTRVLWDGPAGATVITKPGLPWPGGTSFALLSGINFRDGATRPGTWLEVTGRADKFFILDRLHFLGSMGDGVVFSDGWYNLHLRDLRWDSTGGYAIKLIVAKGQNLSTFVLDKFTYDHQRIGDSAPGFILIDNTNNVSNPGTFGVENGRIEVNEAWAGPQAVFVIKYGPSAHARTIGFRLVNVTFDDAGNTMESDVLLYRDTTNASGSEAFILENVRVNALSGILGGTWPSWFPMPDIPAGGLISRLAAQGGTTLLVSPQNYIGGLSDPVITARLSGDSASRLEINKNGKINWGSGRRALDVNLYRAGPDQLKTDGKLLSVSGLGVGNSASATTLGSVVGKVEVFDASGKSLGFIPVYDAIN